MRDIRRDFDSLLEECTTLEKHYHLFNDYSAEIQSAEIGQETKNHVQHLLQSELYRNIISAETGIQYRAQKMYDMIEEYRDRAELLKEAGQRKDRQILYLQNKLQEERTEKHSVEEWDRLQADLNEEKRKRIEAEWALAVYMIKH